MKISIFPYSGMLQCRFAEFCHGPEAMSDLEDLLIYGQTGYH